MKTKVSFLLLILVHLSCGGSSETFAVLLHPIDIRTSFKDMKVDGHTTRFVYVASASGGTVSVIDQISERLVSTDGGDKFNNSPIIVGGELSSIAVEDRTNAPRVFAADADHKQLFAFDGVPNSDADTNFLKYTPVNLGGASVSRASKPIFRNSGRLSTPTITNFVFSPDLKPQLWHLKFNDDSDNYKVTGSRSGVQTLRAEEGKTYTTDDGTFSFLITKGGEPTTNDDEFRFGTVVAKPLDLTSIPVDMQIADGKLFIIGKSPSEVIVLDLTSLTVTTTIPLTDGSATVPFPGKSVVGNGHLYIPNQAAANFFDLDVNALTFNTVPSGVKSIALGLDETNTTLVHIIPLASDEFTSWDLNSSSLKPDIRLSAEGLSFASVKVGSILYGLVGVGSGNVDVIDLVKRKRVDTNLTSDTRQSTSKNQNFYDRGPTSHPELISVLPRDRVARTENWQLIYDSIFPQTRDLPVNVSGNQVNAGTATFKAWGIKAGDQVEFESGPKVLISSVDTEQDLTLVSTPSVPASTNASIRMKGGYLVVGSTSGVQKNRVLEGVTYTSDDTSISLTIRPSTSEPVTQEDFFSFEVVDGINSLLLNGKKFPVGIVTFTPPNKTNPVSYVINQESNLVSILDLINLDERKVIP